MDDELLQLQLAATERRQSQLARVKEAIPTAPQEGLGV